MFHIKTKNTNYFFLRNLLFSVLFCCCIKLKTKLNCLVVNQLYDPEVQNPSGFIGGNVLIKCNIPTFVKDYVSVTSWLQEPAFNIYPSLESGKYKNCIK